MKAWKGVESSHFKMKIHKIETNHNKNSGNNDTLHRLEKNNRKRNMVAVIIKLHITSIIIKIDVNLKFYILKVNRCNS